MHSGLTELEGASASRVRSQWGLFVRKERWSLTWKSRLILLIMAAGFSWAFVACIHPFLAVQKPESASLLVVEGWIPNAALREGAGLIVREGYSTVLTTGGPTGTDAGSSDISDTYASVAAKRLLTFGVPRERIHMVPCWLQKRDRTYASAVAVREWLGANGEVKALNVVTLGVHARRTRLMYQFAFGDDVAIGIVALPNTGYESKRWWEYSEGVKEVISEGAAYLYARLLFRTH